MSEWVEGEDRDNRHQAKDQTLKREREREKGRTGRAVGCLDCVSVDGLCVLECAQN